MKTTTTKFFVTMFVLVTVFSYTNAQNGHEMFLSKPTSQTFINEIVNSDVDGSGNRLDPNRVYVLERGGTWFFNGKIQNVEWTLHMKASDGDGPRPVIYNVANQAGSITGDMIQANGDVILENLTINGLADYDPEAYDEQGFAGIIVIMKSPGYNLIMDGCVIVNSGSALLRTIAASKKVSLTNCIFANYGQMPKKSFGNGRVIDLRDVSIDSLIMVNNTMVNGYDRVVRHGSSTGAIDVIIFDHNTIINNAGTFGTLGFGLVGEKVQVTNNIFYDPMAFGSDTTRYRQPDFKEMNEYYDEAGITDKVKMAWVYHQKEESPSVATEWIVSNNYWGVSSDLKAAFDNVKSQYNPGLEGIGRPLSDYIAGNIDNPDNAFIEEDFSFTNVPDDMSGMVTWYHKPIDQGGAGGKFEGTGYVDYDKRTGIYYADTLDASYPNTLDAYKGGKGGFPVGDLNWYPEIKSIWLVSDSVSTGIEPVYSNSNSDNLGQNYPNPASSMTAISFHLAESEHVSVRVFNSLGMIVETLVYEKLHAGSHTVDFDVSGLKSGIYFYRLETKNSVISKRMEVIE